MKANGFTLVELLIALFIFGMLSAAGVTLLTFSVRAQGAAAEHLEAVGALRRTGALLASDLAQAIPRPTRDKAGVLHPAFRGDQSFSFVRGSWENFTGAPRPSLQKVEYSLVDGRLQRSRFPYLDGADAMPPATLLEGVQGFAVRYRAKDGAWRERWDPEDPSELPMAIEIDIALDGRTLRQLFIVGVSG